MKINDVQRVNGVNPYRKDANKFAGGAGKKEKVKDELSISPEAMEMLNAKEVSGMDPGNQRIADLKRAVSTGTYQVDAGKIAEKLLPYLTNGNE